MPKRILRRRLSVPRRASRVSITVICFCFIFAFILVFFSILKLQKLHKAYAGNTLFSNDKDILEPIRGNVYDRSENLIASNRFEMEVKISKLSLDGIGFKKYKEIANLLNINDTLKYYKKLLKVKQNSITLKEYSYENFDFNKLSKPLIKMQMSNVLYFVPKNYRHYPEKRFYSSFLSFANSDCSTRWGIEEKLNGLLKGEEGYRKYIYSKKLPLFEEKKAIDGHSIYLTLDSAIQFVVESSLRKAVLKEKAKAGHVIVTKPKTGEVLAFASYYNSTNKIKSSAVSDVFEPGSTIKPIIVGLAIENKYLNPNSIIYCENGYYKYGNRVIRDHKRFGKLTLMEVVWHSRNIGMVKVGEKFYKTNLYDNLKLFGFGQKTGIPIPAESRGIFHNLSSWNNQTKTSICFGYGISVNTVQMVTALNTVINGGYFIKPKLIKKVVDSDGNVTLVKNNEKVRVLSEVTSSTMRNILRGVVRNGTGKDAYLKGFDIAGKTGTSKKIVNKKYSSKKYLASFYGFFPAFDPEISIYVVIDEPMRDEYYGGKVAAPLFREVAEKIYPFIVEDLDYKHGGLATYIDLAEMNYGKTKEIKDNNGFVETEIVPDLKGLLLRDALSKAHQAGFNVKCKGDGRVLKQSKSPGTKMSAGSTIILKCSSL